MGSISDWFRILGLHSIANGNKGYIFTNCKDYDLKRTGELGVRWGTDRMREGTEERNCEKELPISRLTHFHTTNNVTSKFECDLTQVDIIFSMSGKLKINN